MISVTSRKRLGQREDLLQLLPSCELTITPVPLMERDIRSEPRRLQHAVERRHRRRL